MHCPNCQTLNKAEANFCSQCGVPMPQEVTPGWLYRDGFLAGWVAAAQLISELADQSIESSLARVKQQSAKRSPYELSQELYLLTGQSWFEAYHKCWGYHSILREWRDGDKATPPPMPPEWREILEAKGCGWTLRSSPP